ncbi:MAG: hypothetical protein R8K54_00270 [Mariprofundaceae bacterium]
MAICPLCGKERDTEEHEVEHYVLKLIRKDHPDWMEKDGACKLCIEYYQHIGDEMHLG